jgi:adenylate cyclase
VRTWQRQHDEALAEFEMAIALNPNFSESRFGAALVFAGEFDRGVNVIEAHMRLDPFYPPSALGFLGLGHYMLKQYPEALAREKESISRSPKLVLARGVLAATYARLGRIEEARWEMADALRTGPKLALSIVKFLFKHGKDAEHYYEGLLMAGLPE